MRAAAAASAQHPGAAPAAATPLSVEVRPLPLHMCALDAGSFVMPAASAAATHARWGAGGCVQLDQYACMALHASAVGRMVV